MRQGRLGLIGDMSNSSEMSTCIWSWTQSGRVVYISEPSTVCRG